MRLRPACSQWRAGPKERGGSRSMHRIRYVDVEVARAEGRWREGGGLCFCFGIGVRFMVRYEGGWVKYRAWVCIVLE